MSQYFVKDYLGEPFDLFGPAHLVALGIVLAILVLLVYNRRHLSPAGRKRFRYALAALLVIDELSWHAWNYFTGQWTVQTMLPLHLCSVLVWVSAYMLITGSYTIYEFAYFLGIGGATQALLTPDAGIYGYPHLRFFQVIISHGSIVVAAVYMTVVEGYRPYWKSLWRVLLWGNIYMAAIGMVNWLLGSNYLFIARKPDTASLIDMLGPWPWYILSMEAIAILMCYLLYLPYALKDRQMKTAPAI